MKAATRRQEEVLDFVKEFLLINKYPPTIREIADHFDLSVMGAYNHVKALSKKGLIRSNTNKSRSIEVIQDDDESPVISIPILGRVAAGIPVMAEENFEGNLLVTQDFLDRGNHFALRVHGDSMIGAGILDGDMAVIKSQATAENGEIVVAMTGDDAVTLKRYYQERTRIRLQAENPAYNPIYTQSVRILGKLVTVIRKY
jgi:repressor LexA